MADKITYDEMMRARAAYFACVSYLDEVIGDLLLRLEADGLLDNTLIVYTTDHGEMAGEHGVWWKNGWYEACTRVPLIFSLPEQRRGKRDAFRWNTPVSLLDLFPTLCAMADVEGPETLDGSDISTSVCGEREPKDRPIYCDALLPRWGEGTEFRMIRWRQYKYVRFRNAPPLFFDLKNDPGEQSNLLTRGVAGKAREALDILSDLALKTMDFDEAERERTVRDGSLLADFRQELPESTGNLYLMPSGKLINADDPLYHPTLIAGDLGRAFDDYRKNNE